MAAPNITITRIPLTAESHSLAKLVTIEIPNGNTTPAEFAAAVTALPELSGPEVILITGRAPIWGYGMLLHLAHATPAVAVFDPRLAGFVVVQTHADSYQLGEVIDAALHA